MYSQETAIREGINLFKMGRAERVKKGKNGQKSVPLGRYRKWYMQERDEK